MTATNFRDLLDRQRPVETDSGFHLLRAALPEDLLARPVPWVDCPTCDGEVLLPGKFGVDPLGLKLCPACHGTGKATVAQLLAWGSAVAQDPSDPDEIVEDWRNRILGVQP